MMRKFITLGLAVSLFSFAGNASAGETAAKLDQFKIDTTEVEITATVKEVDHKARTITLEGPQGNMLSTKVDDDVENFNKVKKGDKVDITLYESTAYLVKKNSPKKDVMKTTKTKVVNATTKKKKPIKVETTEVTQVVDINSVNPKKGTITITGVQGTPQEVKVKDPKNLEGINKGDQVEIIYTESVAFEVRKK